MYIHNGIVAGALIITYRFAVRNPWNNNAKSVGIMNTTKAIRGSRNGGVARDSRIMKGTFVFGKRLNVKRSTGIIDYFVFGTSETTPSPPSGPRIAARESDGIKTKNPFRKRAMSV